MAGPDRDGWSGELQAAALRGKCADRIHWPGILRGAPKWGAFCASEAFILPSHQENFGIAVAEALACGRAVLLSDQVNLSATIADDDCALIEPDTPAGTERMLSRWLALSQEERERMGAAALRSFEKHFDLSASVRAIDGLFAQAVREKAAGRREAS